MKSKFDPQKHHRRSIRLKGYDYTSEGAYFFTIVVEGRKCIFGEIIEGKMHLNQNGEIVQEWWNEIPIHFTNVKLGAFIIMPNHVHGIVFIINERRGEVLSPRNGPDQNPDQDNDFTDQERTVIQGGVSPPQRRPTLGQIIAYFKYQSTKEINSADNTGTITKLWQRNYYEHIIRNEKELHQKTDYILTNPTRWKDDHENPRTKSPGS